MPVPRFQLYFFSPKPRFCFCELLWFWKWRPFLNFYPMETILSRKSQVGHSQIRNELIETSPTSHRNLCFRVANSEIQLTSSSKSPIWVCGPPNVAAFHFFACHPVVTCGVLGGVVGGFKRACVEHKLRDFHDVRMDPICTIGSSDRRGKTKRTTMRVKIEGRGVGSTRKERM
jgi:hypothetical protein